MPNGFAYLMLALWPLVTLVMFRRWPLERALIWSLLGAYLFLPPPPAAFDFPLMPPLTKDSLPSVATFFICLYHCGKARPLHALIPEGLVARALVVLFVLSPIATVATNTEEVFFGRIGLPGLGLKDMVALVLLQFILLIPFLLARAHLATAKGLRELVLAMAVGGLIYSLPMLIEVRLSPQLNIWVYGYFQHMFEQMIRQSGFRPIVFLYHGLWAALLLVMAIICALALAREADQRRRVLWLVAALYLGAVLVLAKSLGSLLYGIYLVPLALLLPTRLQVRIAGIMVLVAIAYPVLKGAGYVPVDWLLDKATAIDPDRAGSLRFRFDNEDILMERALEKPVFGWGSWGRNQIFDPVSGAILTVSDGRWIILIGIFGWVGYLAEFGLIALPVLALWARGAALAGSGAGLLVGPVALLLAINLIDMIPNATLTPLTWLFAGAVLGLAERVREVELHGTRHRSLGWKPLM
ncbi:MAG: hypothetical protein CVT70_03405 [Alphaproteobacteria bacterium HGW-Alphaproteobacteria-1]|jgi:hypothetical protein|nr:MAG: hypothetical protein CVT70_03405 [Alphaproteobacteria bacterium HGW-Alphaproteobacteria-1]